TTPTPAVYTLSLHDALPISRLGNRNSHWRCRSSRWHRRNVPAASSAWQFVRPKARCSSRCRKFPSLLPNLRAEFLLGRWLPALRSEEHTSELQSLAYLVCRL